MSLRVTLACRECGATEQPTIYFLLTKSGTLRVEGATHFYVDGSGALCPKHRPDPLPGPQTETWVEYDRSAVVRDLIDEGYPTVIEAPEPKRRLARLLESL